jgi:hypothetical protein
MEDVAVSILGSVVSSAVSGSIERSAKAGGDGSEIKAMLSDLNASNNTKHMELLERMDAFTSQIHEARDSILDAIQESEERVKLHITSLFDIMSRSLASNHEQTLKELGHIKKEVKKAQFAVELSRMRDQARMLEDLCEQAITDEIGDAKLVNSERSMVVTIVNRCPLERPVNVDGDIIYTRGDVMTSSGYVGKTFLEPGWISAVRGTNLENGYQVVTRKMVMNWMIGKILESINYYNRKYGLTLELSEFTAATPELILLKESRDYSRAIFKVDGCEVCGMNLPNLSNKGKCPSCRGIPRASAGLCQSCTKWGKLTGGLCKDCQPTGCCVIS